MSRRVHLTSSLMRFTEEDKAELVIEILGIDPLLANERIKYKDKHWTPLEWALHHKKPEIIRALLKNGARPGKIIIEAADKAMIDSTYWACVNVFAEELEDPKNEFGFGETLVKATAHNQTVTVEKLVSAKADLRIVSRESRSGVLHLAAQHGNASMLAGLLKAGAKLDQQMEDKMDGKLTPVRYAVRKKNKTEGDWKAIEEFAAVKETGNYGFGDVILHATLEDSPEHNRVETVRKFIKAGADLEWSFDEDHNRPLHLAALRGNKEMVIALLEGGADSTATNKHGKTAIDLARDIDIVRIFLEHEKVKQVKEKEKLAREALEKQKEEEEALKQKSQEAIRLAEQNKLQEQQLAQQKQKELEEQEQKNQQAEKEPLEQKKPEEKTLTETSQKDVPQSKKPYKKELGPTLLRAIEADQVAVVESILAQFPIDEKIDFKDRKITPLQWAVQQNKPQMVKLLLQRGANPGKVIIDAANNNFWECVDVFATESDDPNNEYGFGSALLRIIHNCRAPDQFEKFSRLLRKAQAGLNATFTDGCEVLHCAVLNGDARIVQALLAAGVNPRKINKKDSTAMYLARLDHRWDLIKIFVDHEEMKRRDTQEEVKEQPKKSELEKLPSVPVMIKSLLAGSRDLSYVKYLAEFYKNRSDVARAMIFFSFAALLGGKDDYKQFNDYISDLDYDSWTEYGKELDELRHFLKACLEKTSETFSFFAKIQTYLGNINLFTLFMYGIEKSVPKHYNHSIIKRRFKQSMRHMLQDDAGLTPSETNDALCQIEDTTTNLLQNNGNTKSYYRVILREVIIAEQVDILNAILQQQYPLEEMFIYDQNSTLLMCAAQHNKIESVKCLLAYGAVPDQALGVAARLGHWECVDLLVENASLQEGTSCEEDGALHCAVRKNDLARVTALLKAGANPYCQNKITGETPYSIADKNENWSIVGAILESGKNKKELEQQKQQEEKTQSEATKKKGFPSLKAAFDEAELMGTTLALGALASHYKNEVLNGKSNVGRELVYWALLASAMGKDHPSYQTYYDRIRNFTSSDTVKMLLKTFYLELLVIHKETGVSYFDELKNLGFNSSLNTLLFAIDNELEKSKTNSQQTSLSKSDLEKVKKSLEESIKSICKDTNTKNSKTYAENLRLKTTQLLQSVSPCMIRPCLMAKKFLPVEKTQTSHVQTPIVQQPMAFVRPEIPNASAPSGLYPCLQQEQDKSFTSIPEVKENPPESVPLLPKQQLESPPVRSSSHCLVLEALANQSADLPVGPSGIIVEEAGSNLNNDSGCSLPVSLSMFSSRVPSLPASHPLPLAKPPRRLKDEDVPRFLDEHCPLPPGASKNLPEEKNDKEKESAAVLVQNRRNLLTI